MLDLHIRVDGEKLMDGFKEQNSTILENAIMIRALEEFKLHSLSMEYDIDMEMDVEGTDMDLTDLTGKKDPLDEDEEK